MESLPDEPIDFSDDILNTPAFVPDLDFFDGNPKQQYSAVNVPDLDFNDDANMPMLDDVIAKSGVTIEEIEEDDIQPNIQLNEQIDGSAVPETIFKELATAIAKYHDAKTTETTNLVKNKLAAGTAKILYEIRDIDNHKECLANYMKKHFELYTLSAKIRMPDVIENNVEFLSWVVCAMNAEFIEPMLDMHAQQFFTYMEEEEARRQLKTDPNVDVTKIEEYVINILNIPDRYIANVVKTFKDNLYKIENTDTDVADIEYDVLQYWDEFEKNFNLVSPIFNNDDGKHTKFIPQFLWLFMEKPIYVSYSGISRLASYIQNALYVNDSERKKAFSAEVYCEVLFGRQSAKEYLQRIIVELVKSKIKNATKEIFRIYDAESKQENKTDATTPIELKTNVETTVADFNNVD